MGIEAEWQGMSEDGIFFPDLAFCAFWVPGVWTWTYYSHKYDRNTLATITQDDFRCLAVSSYECSLDPVHR